MPVADELIVLPLEPAAKLAEVSERRLRYWQETGLLEPTFRRRLSSRHVRLYTFDDLIALLVTAELLDRGFSLQHVRKVIKHLRQFGVKNPLKELEIGTTRREIYFKYPDGTWSGSRRPGQLVFITMVIPLEPIYAKIRDAVRRPADTYGRIVKRRGVQSSKPVFEGTRIPVASVKAWLDDDQPVQRILEAYPDLAAEDIEAARSYPS